MQRLATMAFAAALLAAPALADPQDAIYFRAAVKDGKSSCAALGGGVTDALKFGLDGCWVCPKGAILSVRTTPQIGVACKRPGFERTVGFSKREKPRIGLKPCKSGRTLSIDGCVACPDDTDLKTQVLKGKKLVRVRCVEKIGEQWYDARSLTNPGCRAGSFAQGSDCYRCPEGTARTPFAKGDPTKDQAACFGVDEAVAIQELDPPPWLRVAARDVKRAVEEIAARRDMLDAARDLLGRLNAHLDAGGKFSTFRDPAGVTRIIDIANRPVARKIRMIEGDCEASNLFARGAQSVAIGAAFDVATPKVVGGNVTYEIIFDAATPGTGGYTLSASLNAGLPSFSIALGPQVTIYTSPHATINGWSLAVEGGLAANLGLPFGTAFDVAFMFGFDKVQPTAGSGLFKPVYCPFIAGVTVIGISATTLSANVTVDPEFDVGPVYTWKTAKF